MKEKDAAVIKVLADIGVTDEPELTPKQEQQLERALDPDKQFLYDVEKLFNPQLQEDAWDDAETRRTTPNPLPVADSDTFNRVLDISDAIESKLVAKYRTSKKYTNTPYPQLARKARDEMGTMENIPISKIMASEKYLDGEHLRALVHDKSTTAPSGAITLVKASDKYYVQDGNHRIVAAVFRGDKNISALVIDTDNI